MDDKRKERCATFKSHQILGFDYPATWLKDRRCFQVLYTSSSSDQWLYVALRRTTSSGIHPHVQTSFTLLSSLPRYRIHPITDMKPSAAQCYDVPPMLNTIKCSISAWTCVHFCLPFNSESSHASSPSAWSYPISEAEISHTSIPRLCLLPITSSSPAPSTLPRPSSFYL